MPTPSDPVAPPQKIFLVVAEDASGSRIDTYLAQCLPDVSRSKIQGWIKAGAVTADGVSIRPNHRLRGGEALEVDPPAPTVSRLEPASIPLEIVYRDDDILVLVKAAGMVVHPGVGTDGTTLVHALLGLGEELSGVGGEERPGIVHRLDKGTSGLMVVARNDRAHRKLSESFQARQVLKEYQALCWGVPREREGTIDLPLGRDRLRRTLMSTRSNRRRDAVTHYKVREAYKGFAHLELVLETGRTHQIRAHLKSMGHPVVGDQEYGGARWQQIVQPDLKAAMRDFDRLALHAYRLAFDHPCTSERIDFTAPLPDSFQNLLGLFEPGRR